MLRTVAFVLVLGLASTAAFADDDDDNKLPANVVEKIEATLAELGCSGYEEIEVEKNGVIEIDDAECKMGTVDIKLDKDHKVLVISRD
jgi:hypothetical protein